MITIHFLCDRTYNLRLFVYGQTLFYIVNVINILYWTGQNTVSIINSRIDSHLSDSICVIETWSRYLLTVDDRICVTETWSRYLLTVDDSICVAETWSRYLLTVDDSICVAETVWFVYYRLVWCKMSVCGIATLFLSSSVLMLLAAILLFTVYSSCIHTYNAILSVYL